MRRTNGIAVILLAVGLHGARADAQAPADRTEILVPDTTSMNSAERAIMRVERRRSIAVGARDTATLESIYAPEFRGIVAVGSALNRAQMLEEVSRDDPTTTFRVDELAVHTLDAARTSALLTGRLRTLSGTRTVAMTRYIHVYQLRQGRWQLVAAQATAIAAR